MFKILLAVPLISNLASRRRIAKKEPLWQGTETGSLSYVIWVSLVASYEWVS